MSGVGYLGPGDSILLEPGRCSHQRRWSLGPSVGATSLYAVSALSLGLSVHPIFLQRFSAAVLPKLRFKVSSLFGGVSELLRSDGVIDGDPTFQKQANQEQSTA